MSTGWFMTVDTNHTNVYIFSTLNVHSMFVLAGFRHGVNIVVDLNFLQFELVYFINIYRRYLHFHLKLPFVHSRKIAFDNLHLAPLVSLNQNFCHHYFFDY